MGTDLTPAERSALEALDLDGLVALLRELIAIPSLDGDESPAQRRVASWLQDAGLEVDAWSIDLEELAQPSATGVMRSIATRPSAWSGGTARARPAGLQEAGAAAAICF